MHRRIALPIVLTGLLCLLAACAAPPAAPPPSPPPDVAILWSDPPSPAPVLTARLGGVVPDDVTIVRVFASVDCTGPTAGSGDAATFESVGLPVFTGFTTTTEFTAFAFTGGAPICSAPFAFESTLQREDEPNDGLLTANPIEVDAGTAVVLGGIDDPAGGLAVFDFFTFELPAGADVRIETFDTTGSACTMLDTRVQLSGGAPLVAGFDLDDGIGQCSLIDPGVDAFAHDVPAGTYHVGVSGTAAGGAYLLRIEIT